MDIVPMLRVSQKLQPKLRSGAMQKSAARGVQAVDAKNVRVPVDPRMDPSNYVAALERGLDVLTCFDAGNSKLTLTDVAKLTGLSRGTARRFLLTLQSLRYLSGDGKHFWLTPKVLQFGNAYLMTTGLAEAGRSVIQKLTDQFGGSCGLAVLDEDDLVYVGRVEQRRIFSRALEVGSRVPAYCSAVGRVLLSGLAPDDLDRWLSGKTFQPLTPKTITDPTQLRAKIEEARRTNYCLIDSELELGFRMIAVPIRGADGRIVGGLTMGATSAHASLDRLRKAYVPALWAAAAEIEQKLREWAPR